MILPTRFIIASLTFATRLRIRRRHADAAPVPVHDGTHFAGGRASRLVTTEEQLKIRMIRSRVNRRQYPSQLRQTRRRHRSLLKGDVFRGSRPVQIVHVRLIDGPRYGVRHVIMQVLSDTWSRTVRPIKNTIIDLVALVISFPDAAKCRPTVLINHLLSET